MAKGAPISVKNASLLHALRHLNKQERNSILRKADTGLIKNICECALNTLKGNIPLDKKEKQRLRRYAGCLRKLSTRRGSWGCKRKYIIQNGGFLTPLLSAVAGILAAIISTSR